MTDETNEGLTCSSCKFFVPDPHIDFGSVGDCSWWAERQGRESVQSGRWRVRAHFSACKHFELYEWWED